MRTSLSVLSILIYFAFITLAEDSTDNPFYYCIHYCSNTTTYNTLNSTYASNINKLLDNLSSHAKQGGEDFYYAKVEDKSNTVYGSYLCRGDVNATICKDCVSYATQNATSWCPLQKELMLWYDKCMIRYSYRDFFSTMEVRPAYIMLSDKNVSNEGELSNELENTMNDFASKVEFEAKNFLTKQFNLPSENQTIYNLMQCTPDISGADCTRCLRDAIATLPPYATGKKGGRVYNPSCKLRFESFQFYYVNSTFREKVPTVMYSLLPTTKGKIHQKSRVITLACIGVTVASVFLALCGYLCHHKLVKVKKYDVVIRQQNKDIESLKFELTTIEIATKNFHADNKLGEGGFGEVYKGILSQGQEIAVKRLSKSSGQGVEEFKNEVALVAKLQHRNLVRLLGFCLGRGETILVYEFVPNKSLDYFLSDHKKQEILLDWSTRCKIIGGIARGILYLHEDSRLRIIHRDLKTSNILLDAEMNPKISDFGMARIFGIDQTQGNTERIVGTYGYMAPEYAMEGIYSVKSDVFSFGVVLLEILSGKKNSGFHLTRFAPSLLAYAWKLWNEAKGQELMDPSFQDLCPLNDFMRYVHIGLLCVQEDAYNRPTMSSVVQMLTTESINLPKPERPAFVVGRFKNNHGEEQRVDGCSENGLSISTFYPR